MELFAFLLLIAVIYLLVKVRGLSTKVRELDMRLNLLAAPPRMHEESTPATPHGEAAEPAGTTPPPVPMPSAPAIGMKAPPPTVSVPPPVPPETPAPPRKKARTSQEWEWLIGGKLLNRIAAVALVLGVSFFLKYAIDRNWISEWLQIGIGLGIGATLLVGAARMRKRGFQIFSQGLVGAGIAILYIAVYASFNYYSLVSQPVAFIMMSAVTVITFLQAFRYDSLAVSLLGWAGGFATPFLLSRGEANATGLFGYIALLDAGLLAVIATRKRWWVLLPLAFASTGLIFGLWLDTRTGREDDITGAIAVTIFWLLFHGIDLFRTVRGETGSRVLERIIAVLNGVLFYFVFYYLLDDHCHEWMGLLSLAAAGVYAGSIPFITRSTFVQRPPLVHYAVAALALLISATETQFDGFHTTYCYAGEIVLLAIYARRRSATMPEAAATVLLVWAALALLLQERAWNMSPVEGTLPILNVRFLAFVSLIAAAACTVFFASGAQRSWTPVLRGVQHALWAGLLAVLLPVEIMDGLSGAARSADELMGRHLRYLIAPAMALAWATYGAILAFSARPKKILVLDLLAAALGILGALVAASWNGRGFIPPEWFRVILNFHFFASILTIGALIWLARTFSRAEGPTAHLGDVFTAAWVIVGFATLTAEIVDLYAQFMRLADDQGALPFARLMVLAAAWAGYGTAVFAIGERRDRAVPMIAGIVIAVAGWATSLGRGIAFDPVIAFTPILNVRLWAIVFTIGALILFRILASQNPMIHAWLRPAPPVLRIMTALLLLTLVTGEIRDYFERAIALQDPSMAEHELENIKQLMLSGAWLAFSISLMAYGIIGRERTLRVLAIVLFGIAILKIFVYDLSFLETLYRIFSFIGLGLILLVVSYLYQRYKDVILPERTDQSVEGNG